MKRQDSSLQTFYKDTATKDNVHAYLVQFLEGEAIKKVFNREDTSAVAEAKEMIDKAFNEMDYLFGGKVAKKEPINEAR